MALKLVAHRDIIDVQPMDKPDAVALLERKLGLESKGEDIGKLAEALEFIPLAIVQAAAYIRERAPRCSVEQYIEKFYKSDRAKISLLDYEAGQLRRDADAKNSIIITWQISFDHLLQVRPSAADLLSLMSFFDRQGIPESLIRKKGVMKGEDGGLDAGDVNGEQSDSDDSESESSITDEFEDDILTLRNYSFVSVTIHANVFEMHRLVQLATRKWLEANGQAEQWKQQYVKNLAIEFPPGDYQNWAKCQELFPHVKSALAQQPEGAEALKDWALVLYHAAWFAWARGYDDAEKMSVKSMKIRKKLLGEEREETLRSTEMVSLVYS